MIMKTKILTALIVIMALVACHNNANNNGGNEVPPPCEELVYVDNLIEQGKDFDAETLIQGLPGEWHKDSSYMYDENWQDMIKIFMYKGEGGVWEHFIFMADGTGQCRSSSGTLDGDGIATDDIDWQYDTENKNLIITLHYKDEYIEEDVNIPCKILAFSDEYLVFDDGSSVLWLGNMRCVYKRVTDN